MAEPGAEFLERRLQRAQRVPPDQRSPEVAAFIESEALLTEARALLPLTASGAVALPLTAAVAKQKANMALLLAGRAQYVSPAMPATMKATRPHLLAYILPGDGSQLVMHSTQQREDLLARLLFTCLSMPGCLCRNMEHFTALCDNARLATSPANQAAQIGRAHV